MCGCTSVSETSNIFESWIVSAYLLTYTGFIISLAKISDIYGRRPVFLLSTVIFVAFSAGAGWSQTMLQLCVFRALQGIGGGGMYGLSFVMLPEMVPTQKFAAYSALLASLYAFSSLLGPLAGGAINNGDQKNWRWIFWLNIPAGAVVLILMWIALPAGFPHHNLRDGDNGPKHSLRRYDLVGALLILAASVLVVAGLEIGGTQDAWSNATPVSLLTVGCVCWMLFGVWEWSQARRNTRQESVLPWRVITHRFAIGVLLNAFFVGAAFIPAVILLPQRFQVVDSSSFLVAGCRLLALTLGYPIGSALAGILCFRRKVPPFYVYAMGGTVQLLGLGLYTGLDAATTHGPAREQYAFMVIVGVGFGISLGLSNMTAPIVFEPRDMAVGMGAISQFRFLGGSVGIAACAIILNHELTANLRGIIGPELLAELQASTAALAHLPPTAARDFRDSYAQGVKQEMYLITAMAASSLLALVLMIERPLRRTK